MSSRPNPRLLKFLCSARRFLILGLVATGVARVSADPAPVEVLRDSAEGFGRSLNGAWEFNYHRGNDEGDDGAFHGEGFEASGWSNIPVPSNWELQGFAEPKYSLNLEDGLGLYRRQFEVPTAWEGKRVFLRFEGVAYGFRGWVNGEPFGASTASAYNPHTFDVTDLVRIGGKNLLAVRVATRPLGWEFDVNDDWSLSGIYRDVSIFALPELHAVTLETRTSLQADGSASLHVAVELSGSGGELAGTLAGPEGGTRDLDFKAGENDRFEAVLRVTEPMLWTAETPSLYDLDLTVSKDGAKLQSLGERIGLREIAVRAGVLTVNGRPVKLRGVNHHDLEPETGRTVTEEGMRRDLELMRRGNINFVRTSHYPPHPRLIELCDELGFYVMDEISIGKGEKHLNNPRYRANILARVRPTVVRDRNRPSVIIWSVGNENPVTDAELEAARLTKEADPTRPICIPKIGSYFQKSHGRIPEFVDIHAPHYPVNTTLKRYERQLDRPLILTEYAHALGLATDRIQEQWEILQEIPTFAGGAVWHFHDQGLLRKAGKGVDPSESTPYVWKDGNHYYDTSGDQGADGIVYSDRTPQSDFWQVRKAYAPVRIGERALTVEPGARRLELTVGNRYDFRPLEGLTLSWSLMRNGRPLEKGEIGLSAAARESETVEIPVTVPDDAGDGVLWLDLRVADRDGLGITERSVRLHVAGGKPDRWLEDLPAADGLEIEDGDRRVTVAHPAWVIELSKTDGGLVVRDRDGKVLVEGVHPHAGRHLTMAEKIGAPKTGIWLEASALEPSSAEVEVGRRDDGTVRIRVAGTYPRPASREAGDGVDRSDDPLFAGGGEKVEQGEGEALVGGYEAVVSPNGSIRISYGYVPKNATGKLAEAGLALRLPQGAGEFRWIGDGIHPGYPGKDCLNEFGIFHLRRDDLRFQGNRRNTELALLTDASGAGVAMACGPGDVAVERIGDACLLSHNALISGLGNKGVSPEDSVSAGETGRIAGSFTLLPLGPTWPEALVGRFGEPATATDVLKPFFHSYDQ